MLFEYVLMSLVDQETIGAATTPVEGMHMSNATVALRFIDLGQKAACEASAFLSLENVLRVDPRELSRNFATSQKVDVPRT